MKSGAHLSQVPSRTDWATPWPLFRELDAEFHFTLDVCATKHNAKCRYFYSPGLNGLAQDWGTGHVCWMNPPFGREIGAWMEKAWRESLNGNTVVCLVPARTCTIWWHDYAMKGEIRFIKGRVKFEGAFFTTPPSPARSSYFGQQKILGCPHD